MTAGRSALTRAGIMDLFEEMSGLLAERECVANLFVVGGSAMALGYEGQRTTVDVDAAFTESETVRAVASLVAQGHGLPEDWLNDAAKGFMPGLDSKARVVFTTPSLRVQIASPEYLLAMKLMSSRIGRDLDDAVLLWRLVGYTTTEQGLALLESVYDSHLLTARHEYFTDEVRTEAATTELPAPVAYDGTIR